MSIIETTLASYANSQVHLIALQTPRHHSSERSNLFFSLIKIIVSQIYTVRRNFVDVALNAIILKFGFVMY